MIRRPPRSTLFPSRRSSDLDREWWGRAGAWVLIASTTWAALGSLVVFGPGLLSYTPTLVTSVGGLSGVISLLLGDRKSTRLNSSHSSISYAVFCLKKKTTYI